MEIIFSLMAYVTLVMKQMKFLFDGNEQKSY